MAKKPGKIYLGYEEETITEKNLTLLNFTVNKIGGLPNWPPIENVQFPSKCPLCGLHRLLVVQCYAPLEISLYHRTLYVFAWLCVRSQFLDQSKTEVSSIVSIPSPDTNLTWCNGADEWDENDNVEQALGNLQVFDAHNANMSPTAELPQDMRSRLMGAPLQFLPKFIYVEEEWKKSGSTISTSACAPDAPLVPTACPRCGSRLICELQLVPEFAEALRVLPHNIPLSHLHFLSVLVFTCAQSCWQPSDS
ncbi:Uncharacterized protein OBRU01_13217, partial [Operophtera brumata]